MAKRAFSDFDKNESEVGDSICSARMAPADAKDDCRGVERRLGASLGRSGWLSRLSGSVRRLLEGKPDEANDRALWVLDSLEKVLLMWPEPLVIVEPSEAESAFVARKKAIRNLENANALADATFAHLRRLFRCGFRLSSDFRLRQFFVDGEIYRPEGNTRASQALVADLRLGQCRIARAEPVLKVLGFTDLDSPDSFALQFAGLCGECWIFIDSRPELFRREIAAALAQKLGAKPAEQLAENRAEAEGPNL